MSEARTLRIDAAFVGEPLAFETGRLHVVAGPAGAGKSTLLRRIAGLDQGGGEIHLDGLAIHRRKPAARGLRLFAPGPDEQDPELRLQVIDAMRVEAGRVFLLDDPARGLGPDVRSGWLGALGTRLQDTATRSVVLVATRDPSFAAGLPADLVLLDDRRCVARGPAIEVSTNPGTLAIAAIACHPPLATFAARLERNSVAVVDGPRFALAAPLGTPDTALTVAVHPDDLRPTGQGGDVTFDGVVTDVTFDGEQTDIALQARCGPLTMRRPGFVPRRVGERLRIHVDPGALMIFDAAGRRLQASERAAERRALAGASG